MIEVAPITYVKLTYEEAILYCQFLEHNGHRDWRMPTYEEYYHDKNIGAKWSWYVGRHPTYPTGCVYPVRDV
jgi:hypothetical protein